MNCWSRSASGTSSGAPIAAGHLSERAALIAAVVLAVGSLAAFSIGREVKQGVGEREALVADLEPA